MERHFRLLTNFITCPIDPTERFHCKECGEKCGDFFESPRCNHPDFEIRFTVQEDGSFKGWGKEADIYCEKGGDRGYFDPELNERAIYGFMREDGDKISLCFYKFCLARCDTLVWIFPDIRKIGVWGDVHSFGVDLEISGIGKMKLEQVKHPKGVVDGIDEICNKVKHEEDYVSEQNWYHLNQACLENLEALKPLLDMDCSHKVGSNIHLFDSDEKFANYFFHPNYNHCKYSAPY